MSRPESPQERSAGWYARWDRALASERSEAAGGPLGPCHGLGGAFHRCDGPASWRQAHSPDAIPEAYRWCERAAREAIAAGMIVEDGLRCPDCGGEPCHEGRELVPLWSPEGERVGEDICEHDCHDHDREEDDNDG